MKNNCYLSFLFLILSISAFSQSNTTAIDSIKRVLAVVKSDTARVNTLNSIADKYKESNPDSTAFYAVKATNLARKTNYNFGLANAYINSGNSNIILGNYRQANQYFEKAQAVFETLLKADSKIEIKRIQNGLARAFASQ